MGQFERFAIMVSLCAALTACVSVTAPQYVEVEKTRTYTKARDQVWEAVISYLAGRNFPVKTVEKDSGIVYAEIPQFPVGFADCGQSTSTVQLSRQGSLNVVVKPVEGGTEVSVNPAFSVTRAAEGQQWTIDCQSKGVLERQMLDALS
jgi:hypothetical protein